MSPEQLDANLKSSRPAEVNASINLIESALRGVITSVQVSASPPIEQLPVRIPNHTYSPSSQPISAVGKERPRTASTALASPNVYLNSAVGHQVEVQPTGAVDGAVDEIEELLLKARRTLDEVFNPGNEEQ